MDRFYTHELRRLHKQFEATLTPKQRQLLLVGALKDDMCTSRQIELRKNIDQYLVGLTPEQAARLGAIDVFMEGVEKGQAEGERLGRIMKWSFIISLIVFGFSP